MTDLLYIIVFAAIPVALALCGVLALNIHKGMTLAKLYATGGRDFRFVCALLRHELPGGKWRILRNPCLLSDDQNAPPRADLVVIGGGGVLVLTVEERTGHFSTPPTGDWTHWNDGVMEKLPNRFVEGRQYVSVLNGLLVRAGVSCPVMNIIVLSDDVAGADDLYAENVMTGNQLVPYVKRFCKGSMLSTGQQQHLRQVIAAHHAKCRKALESADAAAKQAMDAPITAGNLFGDAAPASEKPAAQTITCPSCGEQMPARFRICGVCGAPLHFDGEGNQ